MTKKLTKKTRVADQQAEPTPGPWSHGAGIRLYEAPDGTLYRLAFGSRRANESYKDIHVVDHPDAEDIANACLMLWAPNMLALLESLLAYWDHGSPVHAGAELVDEARAIIAGAKGRELLAR
ncbi:MAG: hypothetical protein ACRDJN_16690 [Chloroflexota bacterium]